MRQALIRLSTRKPAAVHAWDRDDAEVFQQDLVRARQWLNCFPSAPDFSGRAVAEIGCGLGALCAVAAGMGASRVLGIEADEAAVRRARALVIRQSGDSRLVPEFKTHAQAQAQERDAQFDCILSQAAFEHIMQPDEVVRMMERMLKPGGTLYVGFGPLWHSPYGSHLASVCLMPWAHLWAGEALLSAHNRARPHDVKRTYADVGLNQRRLSDFERIFRSLESCEEPQFAYNASVRRRAWPLYLAVEPLRRIPCFREFLTVSLFVVIRKRNA